jgi:hypothetical protein
LSNTNDSFIDEVTEEVRRDKLFALMRRYGWIAIVAVLALVGGTAWKQWSDAQAAAEAQAMGDSLYAAIDVQDDVERADALAALDVAGPAAAPKLMLEAAALSEAGETEQAAAKLALVAQTEGFPRVWRDLAQLKRVILLGRSITPEDRLAQIAPLTTPGAPYRVLAREQEALARYDLGEVDGAIAIFDELFNDQDASVGLRLRAAQMKLVLEETRDGA